MRAREAQGDLNTYSGEASDIDAGKEGRNAGGWLVDFTEPFETGVWDRDAGFFRVYGGVREVGGLSEI